MSQYTKPLPVADRDTLPFWDACKRHELTVQQCPECGLYCFPPLPMCYGCTSMDRRWVKVSGRGRVYSWIIVYHPTHPDFAEDAPYPVVVVTLDEQDDVRMVGQLVDCSAEELRVDMPMEVVFHDVTPDVSLPFWRPRNAVSGS